MFKRKIILIFLKELILIYQFLYAQKNLNFKKIAVSVCVIEEEDDVQVCTWCADFGIVWLWSMLWCVKFRVLLFAL